MPAPSIRATLRRPRLTVFALMIALVCGVFAAVAPGHRAAAAEGSISLFSATTVPARATDPDKVPVELGMKFTSSVAGKVTGVRFYKSSTNLGTHTGSMWNTKGQRLATVTFSNETASGWQQASFAAPVAVTANTTYVVSYYAPKGQYASDEGFWEGRTVSTPPLTGLANGASGANGVYRYGTGGGYPQSSYKATNVGLTVSTASIDRLAERRGERWAFARRRWHRPPVTAR